MKTNSLKVFLSLIFYSLIFSTTLAQDSLLESDFVFNDSSFATAINVDDLAEGVDMYTLDETILTVDHFEAAQDPVDVIVFAATMLGLGVGFGWFDDDTLWCLKAAYFFKVAMLNKTAFYLALGATYEGLSGNNNFKRSLFDFALRMMFFTPITMYSNVHLVYGLLLAYGIGKNKFDGGFEQDINRILIGALIGLNIMLSPIWSILLQTNVFSWQEQTLKEEGFADIKNDFTSFIIAKNAIFAISFIHHFGRRAQRQLE